MALKIAFTASRTPVAQTARAALIGRYGDAHMEDADVIVALGGDGFMLQTLHGTQHLPASVYGMNRGTIGFLMNEYSESDLVERLKTAEEAEINPLSMTALCVNGAEHDALAINEVSLLRAGPQAAKLRITVDGRLRMEELVCDGALVATPAGSTAYNYSAHGPVLPIGSDVLAMTAVAAFRPRRWRGALLPKTATVRFDVLEPEKRPVMAEADSRAVHGVESVVIRSEPKVIHRILF
ncbi:MAG: NAD kinase, partial [Paracoccaceae bacterium]